ncbi:MAG: nucleoside triphosphatase NudI [Candidatus Nealsonbacteria bacterium CG02_land_8_20_14_3_00_37_10]|uniref:Nucleoside triphosphatase NudI n=2 Tax=Candidatus Nealsoniibacteriota TaxID=1817911 RepID=A0A2G9YYF1_9BACT|nr:MAG: nucleoside triphosphatase NudI [Candidatus Nealsonbacteria bacterium CG23_combo_of_CG06-09_8_20_14_all_37_18]PIV45105.1 MAG: nucleoside triphosphatase NudI [Candidatus Nealsonbacteria bacterium CG02_land_8_20_14_3_00_37_10]
MRTRIIVSAIIENDKGEILIGKKYPNKGVYLDAWHIPGGGIEEGERIEEGLKREIKEETNLEIADIRPIHFSDDITTRIQDGKTEKIQMIFLEFKCKAKTENLSPSDDLETLKWVPKAEIKNYNLTPPGEKLFKFLGMR